MAQWYCNSNGQQSGPMETAELKQWIASGRLQQGDLVWRDGMAQWAAVSTVQELAADSGEIPFAPGHAPPGADYNCSICGGMFTVDNVYDNGGGTFICKRCHSQRTGKYPPAYGGAPGSPYMSYASPYAQAGPSTGLIVWGYVCAGVSLIFCPIGFGIAGIVIGIQVSSKGNKSQGTAITILSVICMILGIIIGIAVMGAIRR